MCGVAWRLFREKGRRDEVKARERAGGEVVLRLRGRAAGRSDGSRPTRSLDE